LLSTTEQQQKQSEEKNVFKTNSLTSLSKNYYKNKGNCFEIISCKYNLLKFLLIEKFILLLFGVYCIMMFDPGGKINQINKICSH